MLTFEVFSGMMLSLLANFYILHLYDTVKPCRVMIGDEIHHWFIYAVIALQIVMILMKFVKYYVSIEEKQLSARQSLISRLIHSFNRHINLGSNFFLQVPAVLFMIISTGREGIFRGFDPSYRIASEFLNIQKRIAYTKATFDMWQNRGDNAQTQQELQNLQQKQMELECPDPLYRLLITLLKLGNIVALVALF